MIETATDDDYSAMFGTMPPQEWFGLVAKTQWLILGIGAVYRGTDGKYWMMFTRSPGVRMTKTAHMAGKRLVQQAKDKGLEVRALADNRISGAALWLRKLGFKQSTETIEGYPVWTLSP